MAFLLSSRRGGSFNRPHFPEAASSSQGVPGHESRSCPQLEPRSTFRPGMPERIPVLADSSSDKGGVATSQSS